MADINDLENVRVLLIEDDPDLSLLVREELELWGAHVLVAHTLKEARALFSENIDVILSDVRLPDGESVTFLKEIPRLFPNNVPIRIIVTGFADISPEDEEEMGIDGIFPKPTDWDEVVSTVRQKVRSKRNAA